MITLKSILSWTGVLSAILAAGLWFWAAWGIKYDPLTLGGWGDGTTEKQFLKQGRFNAYAATATGVSAFLQAIVLSFP